ncbi:uncharacterized protein PHACADRAFT_246564 [Phanerochaete carnosa HHB-10118-sp]|uniref:Uncharacterized protein n=1 Tax=Phanerochaete carnosa (strain HHB-10118-sp) TaxID=650164 RepID=K5XC36_PHACS|nr:uncharacterized protein PHACADRAFT_246564 [Phanerochaete carnosa HHB-10118-sp]EKM60552.1 hypothetical protein PHACADRAFT_246564 [Phanerochaete carnosa HHB-10118-sp]
MNACILTPGVRKPPHTPTFTSNSWSTQLSTGPQAFGRIGLHVSPPGACVQVSRSRIPYSTLGTDADLTMLMQADWANVSALDELAITMHPGTACSDDATVAMARCMKTIVASLAPTLRITAITICNPLPVSVLRYRATHDVSGLIAQLRRVLYGLDAELSRRIAGGTLQRVVFASHPNATPIAEDEKARVREFFPALAAFHDVI